ncbi:BOI-related E3 ubiquitin-protein ligase 1 [Cucurbita moschata]|uniref:BOI-related E3 ubiquitin-protein ligase 1 n=1 Tax=Cucurbita moschata TaxID=3662 RepID=A0A6J1H3V8_CUCMO|nr:BOI-related E3 ubiquitin-protein ligase 1 [Cucurbita moschata]
MAVQAQYPSNVLLLNRNGQEGHDYPLQPQPGGFLDQTHMVFNNSIGGNNSRKRGREISTAITSIAAPINLAAVQQPRPPLLVDLAKLHNHQNNVVSTGLRLSSGDHQLNQPPQQQHQQQQQQQQQHHQQQQHQHNHNLVPQSSSAFFSLLSDDFASNFKRQQDEIDQFLQAQEEKLRRTLAEKRQRHYRALLDAVEKSVFRRLREREAEVEKATRRNAELEARAAQLSIEAQVWQAKARAQEATAVSLQAQLQRAMSSGGGGGGGGDGGDGGTADDAESAHIDPDRVAILGPSCRECRKRLASVVLLPCRHLCLCTDCDRVAQTCPLCHIQRSSSVEVYLS